MPFVPTHFVREVSRQRDERIRNAVSRRSFSEGGLHTSRNLIWLQK